MNVLVACEFSGIVRDAFLKKGHYAVSCDLLPTESKLTSDWNMDKMHVQGDVLEIIDDNWDLIVAHPPCQYICNSGVRWLYTEEGRWKKMVEGARFFAALLNADCPRIAVENPVMHGYGMRVIKEIVPPSVLDALKMQTIQPYEFGHPESKRTQLWLKGLPKMTPTRVLSRPDDGWENQTPSGQNKLGPSKDRWKQRATTYKGIAKAMATQWLQEGTQK